MDHSLKLQRSFLALLVRMTGRENPVPSLTQLINDLHVNILRGGDIREE